MAEHGQSAGAGAAQPDPSRIGAPIEGGHPLQPFPPAFELFLKHRPAFMANAEAVGAACHYFSPANMLAKLALGKYETYEAEGHCVFVNGDGAACVMPGGEPQAYFAAVLAALDKHKKVFLVGEAVANHLRGTYGAKPYGKEYLGTTEGLIQLPGGGLKTLRNEIRYTDQRAELVDFEEAIADELMRVNKGWYAEAKDRHFRPYDKTSIDWLIQNWRMVEELAPDAQLSAALEKTTGRIVAFCVVSNLTNRSWNCFTRRYVRDTGLKSVNLWTWWKLAHWRDPELFNDGTADSAEIRHMKEKYSDRTLQTFAVGKGL